MCTEHLFKASDCRKDILLSSCCYLCSYCYIYMLDVHSFASVLPRIGFKMKLHVIKNALLTYFIYAYIECPFLNKCELLKRELCC